MTLVAFFIGPGFDAGTSTLELDSPSFMGVAGFDSLVKDQKRFLRQTTGKVVSLFPEAQFKIAA